MNEYYVQKDGDRRGPYTRADLREELTSGNFASTDLVESRDGLAAGAPPQFVSLAQLLNSPPPLPAGKATTAPTLLERQLAAKSHQPLRKPPSNKPLWIGVSAGLVLMFAGAAFLFYIGKSALQLFENYAGIDDVPEQSELPLLAERTGHITEWTESSFEAAGDAPDPPADVFQKVNYPSSVGDLVAYVSPDPGDGGKHPAMVWAHGGFGGIGADFWQPASRKNDQSARAFREAGIVLMCPSWRGENSNPGRFELFYGEVDDLLAAVEYVKSLPYVDPERVYIGGHSTGGTLALLAAVAQADCRAVFSFGGAPNMNSVMENGEGYGNTPYAIDSTRDHDLRNPIRYTRHIQRPTFYFEGTDSWYTYDAWDMEVIAREHGVPFEQFELPGDHFDILAPTTSLVATKIVADTDPGTCKITFTLDELELIGKAIQETPLVGTLNAWLQNGGDLSEALANLEDDAVVASVEDAGALTSALRKSTNDGNAADVAALAGLMDECESESAKATFEKGSAPMLRDWIRRQTANPFTTEESVTATLTTLASLAANGAEPDGALIAEIEATGFARGNDAWSSVLWNLETESPAFATMMTRFLRVLPDASLCEQVMRIANSALLNGEWTGTHPFDTPAGRARLQEWLQPQEEPGAASRAFASAVALAFISNTTREGLVPLGLAYPDVDVQLEAAWADVKTNGPLGLPRLQEACLNLEYAATARAYLEELDRGDAVPGEAREPEFAATADIIDWLKHPNELGSPPESLKVYDTRTIFWPPADERITVWLFEFTYRFDDTEPFKTGYAMAGSTKWSFFDEYHEPPAAKDLYVKHCAWELTQNSEYQDDEPEKFSEEDANKLLSEKNPDW
ncbi:MAG: alpha/beta fold hydrolase [Verrucomicrobiae bacterium]|nr:alpha/beta fold hydrolase [Verrucomicrobiae bacterium]